MRTNLTKEDLVSIMARGFFEDNPNDYEDYREAYIEMSGQGESFISFYEETIQRPPAGHKLFLGQEGHLASMRMEDGFFQCPTFTEEEAEAFVEKFEKRMAVVPDYMEPIEVLPQIGWKEVIFTENKQ